MKHINNFEGFLYESDERKLSYILSNLTKDPEFIKYLHNKGKTQVTRVSSAELSMGLCTYVAKYVEEVHGIGKALGSHGGKDAPVSHAFIEYNGRYYDAASPKGVDNVWDLWNFEDASYATHLEPKEYEKLIQKNIQSFELKK